MSAPVHQIERVIDRPRAERCVLCLDDDYEFLKSLEFFLPEQINRNCGPDLSYRFVFLAEPIEALEAIRELVAGGETVAMLITDQQMPHMKGTEFLAQAREMVPNSTRILLTGHSGIDAAIVGINERLLDKYLTKPIESEHDFMLSVKHLLERFELQRQVTHQNALIHGLYDFANTLNAAETLDDTVDVVADFTRSALDCEHVQLLLAASPEPSEAGSQAQGRAGIAASGASRGPKLRSTRGSQPISGLARRVEDCPHLGELVAGPDPAWPSGRVAYAVLESGDQVFGLVLAWELAQGPAFTQESIQTLGYIAASASVAVQRQRNRARLEEIALARARHLEAARNRLQILDRLKIDFLSFVSHELRTPLNHIAAVDMIEEEMDQESRSRMVGIVRSGYERLERFIVSSLEYFEWFSPRLEHCEEVTDLNPLVRGVLGRIAAKNAKPIQWEIHLPDEPCPALIPQDHADQLLTILVNNAIKFSPEEPRVRVELSLGTSCVTLRVMDHGKGFPPAWADELFRPFTIADSLHHGQGTALNLAKAAAMVETYGGSIRAYSAGPEQGATFTVELPTLPEEQRRVIDLGDARNGSELDKAA